MVAVAALEGGEPYERALAYWRQRMNELPPGPELPLAKAPSAVRRSRFAHREARLGREAWSRFQERAGRAGLTATAALAAVYAEVVGAWSRNRRFVARPALFNRLPLHPQVQDLVANFSSTLLVEVDATGRGGFAERARRLQERIWSDIDHALVSGVRVLRELTRRQGGARATAPVVFASTLGTGGGAGGSGEPAGPSAGRALRLQLAADAAGLARRTRSPRRTARCARAGTRSRSSSRPACWTPCSRPTSSLVERLALDEGAWAEPLRGAAAGGRAGAPRGGQRHGGAGAGGAAPRGRSWQRAAAAPEAPAVIARRLDARLRRARRALAAALAAELRAARRRAATVSSPSSWTRGGSRSWRRWPCSQAGAAYLPIDAGPAGGAPRATCWRTAGSRLALTQPRLDAALDWPAGVRRIVVASVEAGSADAAGRARRCRRQSARTTSPT